MSGLPRGADIGVEVRSLAGSPWPAAETDTYCRAWHAVGLSFGLQVESPENGNFPGIGRRFLGIFGPKNSNMGLQRLLAMRKARVSRALLIQRRKFPET